MNLRSLRRHTFEFVTPANNRIVAEIAKIPGKAGIFWWCPDVPQLSGTLTRGTIAVGELKRTYRTYVPRGLAKGAPLGVSHGAGENGA